MGRKKKKVRDAKKFVNLSAKTSIFILIYFNWIPIYYENKHNLNVCFVFSGTKAVVLVSWCEPVEAFSRFSSVMQPRTNDDAKTSNLPHHAWLPDSSFSLGIAIANSTTKRFSFSIRRRSTSSVISATKRCELFSFSRLRKPNCSPIFSCTPLPDYQFIACKFTKKQSTRFPTHFRIAQTSR